MPPFRFPREGGDPDPFAQTERGPLNSGFGVEHGAGGRGSIPPSPNPLPLKGGKGLSDPAFPCAAQAEGIVSPLGWSFQPHPYLCLVQGAQSEPRASCDHFSA
jgi:hypothetical protein